MFQSVNTALYSGRTKAKCFGHKWPAIIIRPNFWSKHVAFIFTEHNVLTQYSIFICIETVILFPCNIRFVFYMYGGNEWSQESPVGRLWGGRSGVWFPSRQEIFIFCKLFRGGTRHRSWKVTGSIPDGVIGIFNWHNPSGRTMALGSTQPLAEMSTMDIFLGVKATGAWGW
jgi:hypothetical protein